MAGAVASSAQYKQPNAINPNDGLTLQLVKTGLYLIKGQGSNSVLRLSANGLILVDGASRQLRCSAGARQENIGSAHSSTDSYRLR
jgi:hypothetical protein